MTGERLPYHLVLRAGRRGWWVPVVGLLSFVVGMVLVIPLLLQIPLITYLGLTGTDVLGDLETTLDLENPTPLGLAYLNLVLAGAIPLTWLLVRTLHRVRPRWLASVGPRIRWKYLVVCVGLSLLSLLATVLVSAVLPAQETGAEISGELNDFTRTTRDFVLVVLFLTPLQAAGEEYAFRGYLTQAFGGLFKSRIAAVVIPSVLFALAHGGQSAPIFFDRFAFGLVAGTLVILTGGLEAGIAMHVLNNWLAFGAALAFGDMASSLNPTGGTWWSIPVTLTQSLTYLALALWVARRMGLRTTTEPGTQPPTEPPVLEGSRGLV